ncbi:MAG: cytochrome C [Magnetococcales bacterium]|nr:cytochrome C [Magnetococcales bacterium]
MSISIIAASFSFAATPLFDNATCQICHDGNRSIEVPHISPYAEEGEKRLLQNIEPEKYHKGSHGSMTCMACHSGIVSKDPPHQKGPPPAVDCAGCHEKLWKEAASGKPLSPALQKVEQKIAEYRQSFHARPNKDDPRFVNATCHECHDSHFFQMTADKSSPDYAAWRLTIPKLCGKCHEEQLDDYALSVHGREAIQKQNSKSAICTDCHTSHNIIGALTPAFKLLNPDACGQCHKGNLATYRDTYHGQVNQLGYPHTAKCFDCHENHKIRQVKDEKSSVYGDNKLKTCQKCHDGEHRPLATVGFKSYSPHAHAGDYERYPQVWLASRFMTGLFWLVFAFFWLHSGLWYYREWQERRKPRPHVNLQAIGLTQIRHVRRFSAGWRHAHLFFALTVMTLVLTGMTVHHAHTPWAPVVSHWLGGVQSMGILHRLAATLLLTIFLGHLVYILQHILRQPGFRWFGPDSLIPNWKDVTDCRDMFKWFFAKGEKPRFDRWTYFEKFDYWAVFWGMAVIGSSGLLLAFPHVAGQYLPGWVFNVAALVHGEEAFLAAVFIFTVHFFNNHFRPDKLPPPDVVMFTGSQSLEEFQRDHPAHYDRLVNNGELERFLVPPPSNSQSLAARGLGLLLLAAGFILLILVVQGYFTS